MPVHNFHIAPSLLVRRVFILLLKTNHSNRFPDALLFIFQVHSSINSTFFVLWFHPLYFFCVAKIMFKDLLFKIRKNNDSKIKQKNKSFSLFSLSISHSLFPWPQYLCSFLHLSLYSGFKLGSVLILYEDLTFFLNTSFLSYFSLLFHDIFFLQEALLKQNLSIKTAQFR